MSLVGTALGVLLLLVGLFYIASFRRAEVLVPAVQNLSSPNKDGPNLSIASPPGEQIAATAPSTEQATSRKINLEIELGTLAKRFSRVLKGEGLRRSPRLIREEVFGLREGRLMALAYPDQIERLAIGMSEDPSRTEGDRFFGMLLLGYLAQQGRPESANSLFRLANAADKNTSDRAIYALWPSDLDGRYKNLYMQKSALGYEDAFEPLSFFADSSTLTHVKSLLALPDESTPTSFSTKFFSRNTLQKYEILMSPDSQAKLADLIVRGESEDADWALEVSKRRPFPNLPALLRQALDLALRGAKDAYARIDSGPPLPGQVRPSFDELYRSRAEYAGQHSCYDEILITLLTQKPELLTDSDRARLRTFGYGCDPKARLEELLSAESRGH
ncbi:MAG TPA: hypothetical protein VKU80_09200 [Planctomycetota bacterium]|nr:hypothetical protein [Planctomycetota bacterium]